MNEIANIILSFIGIILTSVIIPYIKEKTTAEQKRRIKSLVRIAVSAAEQLIQGGQRGKERYKYVSNYLEKRGIKISDGELKAMIESEVYNLNNMYIKKGDYY
jgi:LL-H family phage holin